ncbi:preprotein translocase subunit SecE [Fimbriimonas ginsengisoli]|uniref:Protein translocase subunit SecE n=1 Tax=Fimbriimonas ginsengisoli Gsoil 348 TaxID=661478 RepID=A0A068NKV2_FIMGI|nr:preprotein translocase subunit SecE [Fimbriimonas ginsengisoli]AIE83425.1 preprotein translocase subunit SecE [Fimbriimonas ginsengisoli Gsoil 348]
MSNSGSGPDDPKQKNLPEPGSSRPRGGVPVPKSKRGLKGFFNEVVREMKKVSWPTRAETNRLTGVVLAVCVMLVIFLTTIGYVFQFIVDFITKGRVG